MLWGQSPEYDGTFVRDHGSMLGSLMITAQITFLNLLYGRLAAYLTDVENQRTEVAYEDSLIVKVAARPVLVLAMLLPECKSAQIFQFCNSYFALFYIAFIKSQGFSIFDSFGEKDLRGRPYKDMCGDVGSESFSILNGHQVFVRGDCMGELGTLMLSQLVIKPCIEIFVQLVGPWLKKQWAACKHKVTGLRLCRTSPVVRFFKRTSK
eukprot:441403-Prymnesium_polylepis.1